MNTYDEHVKARCIKNLHRIDSMDKIYTADQKAIKKRLDYKLAW